jgi:hypothetical protein
MLDTGHCSTPAAGPFPKKAYKCLTMKHFFGKADRTRSGGGPHRPLSADGKSTGLIDIKKQPSKVGFPLP